MSSSTKLSLLSELTLRGPVWLASDIHLGEHNPGTCRAFYEFLETARQQASALILLGDLFEAWIGDDLANHPPAWLASAMHELARTAHNMPVWILGGNRDFLVGRDFIHRIGAQPLTQQAILTVRDQETAPQANSGQFLLAHGDEFCTADTGYQRLRRVVRNSWIQRGFLALPLRHRERIARRMRNTSQSMDRGPLDPRYDIQDVSLAQRLHELGLTTCIHGHTHRPGHYRVRKGRLRTKRPLDRWVLPDWEHDVIAAGQRARGGWLTIDHTGLTLHRFPA